MPAAAQREPTCCIALLLFEPSVLTWILSAIYGGFSPLWKCWCFSFQVQSVSLPLESTPGQSQKLWHKPSPCHVPYSGVCCIMPCILGSMQDGCSLLDSWLSSLQKSSITVCTWPVMWGCWGGRALDSSQFGGK